MINARVLDYIVHSPTAGGVKLKAVSAFDGLYRKHLQHLVAVMVDNLPGITRIGVDNIVITPVPQPAVWSLTLLALAAAWGLSRRRQLEEKNHAQAR